MSVGHRLRLSSRLASIETQNKSQSRRVPWCHLRSLKWSRSGIWIELGGFASIKHSVVADDANHAVADIFHASERLWHPRLCGRRNFAKNTVPPTSHD